MGKKNKKLTHEERLRLSQEGRARVQTFRHAMQEARARAAKEVFNRTSKAPIPYVPAFQDGAGTE